MELSDHNVLLVLIDSVGYQSAIKKIIMALGFNINNMASEYLQQCDKQRQYDMKHWHRDDIHCKRILMKSEMIRNGMKQLKDDAKEQVDYGPSQALEGIFKEVTGEPQCKKYRTGPVFCPFCKKKGHVTAHSKHCDKNPLNIAARLAREAAETAIVAHVAVQPIPMPEKDSKHSAGVCET